MGKPTNLFNHFNVNFEIAPMTVPGLDSIMSLALITQSQVIQCGSGGLRTQFPSRIHLQVGYGVPSNIAISQEYMRTTVIAVARGLIPCTEYPHI